MKAIKLHEAAKLIMNLLEAVAKINNNKCPLSTSQVKLLIDGGDAYQKIYINKHQGGIRICEPPDESLYICINITLVEDDKYIISIK